MRKGGMQSRTRLPAEERRRQLISAAERELLELGHMPVSLEEVASAAGVSKALIYTYFPTQHDLFNAVLEARLEQLGGVRRALDHRTTSDAASAAAMVYLQQVAEAGPVIHYVLRDAFMSGSVSQRARKLRGRLAGPLVRRLRGDLSLSVTDAVAAFNLLATIPEELGVQVSRKEVSLAKAREICESLIAAALAGLKAASKTGQS